MPTMNENKQTKQARRERGANDIIFIFVNEFRTEEEKKKLLTSAGLYFVSHDVDNQNRCSRESERRSTKGGLRFEWKSNK